MRPKLVWRVPRWSSGALVRTFPAIRAGYGDRVADIIEWYADVIASYRDEPTTQDRKHSLAAIAAAPEAADTSALDRATHNALAVQAWRRYGAPDIAARTHAELAECAALTLAETDGRDGRSATDGIAVDMIRALLRARPRMQCAERDELIADALVACGLGGGTKNVERLRKQAGQVF